MPEDPSNLPWRCFYCDAVFHDREAATVHFGHNEGCQPICKFTPKQIRLMERRIEEHRDEDTDLHRQIRSLETAQAAAVQRAEELGYDRGLQDAERLRTLLTPRKWDKEMHDAWHSNIPDVSAAFAALLALANNPSIPPKS